MQSFPSANELSKKSIESKKRMFVNHKTFFVQVNVINLGNRRIARMINTIKCNVSFQDWKDVCVCVFRVLYRKSNDVSDDQNDKFN